MTVRLKNYLSGFRIVSLALRKETRDDLLKDCVDFLWVDADRIMLFPDGEEMRADPETIDELKTYHDYDVFEIWPDGRMFIRFDNSSIDNYFFVTAKCNSNCIMCPSSDYSRREGENGNISTLIELAKHIPVSASHLTITGGEPFMAGMEIFNFFSYLRNKYTGTDFLVLTNGRIFAVRQYVELLNETLPERSIIGIPLHGSNAAVHDAITRAEHSFEQTLRGIKNLLRCRIRVELRLVVSRMNVDDFMNMAELIVREVSSIEYVSIIAMEMTGNAFVNRDAVWIPYRESFEKISDAVKYLIQHGIDVKLYNFPLCIVDYKYRALCEKSISPDKVRYAEECAYCNSRKACGGLFSGTVRLEANELRAIR